MSRISPLNTFSEKQSFLADTPYNRAINLSFIYRSSYSNEPIDITNYNIYATFPEIKTEEIPMDVPMMNHENELPLDPRRIVLNKLDMYNGLCQFYVDISYVKKWFNQHTTYNVLIYFELDEKIEQVFKGRLNFI